MTKEGRLLFLSMMIGDGYIGSKGYARILHCGRCKDYVEWKWALLKKAGFSLTDVFLVDNSGFPAYSFGIRASRVSKLYRRVLYSTGSHHWYRRKLLNQLNPLHLAILYMDDGGLSQKKKDGVVVANDLILNTHTTRENNQVLIDYFYEVWGIKFTQVLNRGKYRLRCGTKEARKFLEIVRPYVSLIPSMSHKLAIKTDALDKRGRGLD